MARNPIPVSPPASVNGENSPIPQPGFGWEFNHILEARVVEKDHEMHARFQRYGRFGMRWEEARLPTPEHFRKAYDELVDAIANDRTPSPSSDAPVGDMPRLIKKSKKAGDAFDRNNETRIGKRQRQAQAKRLSRNRKQPGLRQISIHGMTTRSKAAALQGIRKRPAEP